MVDEGFGLLLWLAVWFSDVLARCCYDVGTGFGVCYCGWLFWFSDVVVCGSNEGSLTSWPKIFVLKSNGGLSPDFFWLIGYRQI